MEVETLLNSDYKDGCKARKRLAAYLQREVEVYEHPNFVLNVIKLLAQYGLLIHSHKHQSLEEKMLNKIIIIQAKK